MISTSGTLFGVTAYRGGGSVLGASEAPLKLDGEPVRYRTKEEAEGLARRLNAETASPNVRYVADATPRYGGLSTRERLTVEYCDWVDAQNLPKFSADDLICEDISPAQREHLSAFIRKWETYVEVWSHG